MALRAIDRRGGRSPHSVRAGHPSRYACGMEQQATVRIWLAAEWQPLRTAFLDTLPNLLAGRDLHEHLAVVSESTDAAKPVGRAANWVASSLEGDGERVERVEIGDAFPLGSVPAIGVTELLLYPDSAQVDQLYALGIWSRFVPRRRRWLMRISPYLDEEIVANANLADPRLSLQIAEWKGNRVLIAATDPIAAEVIGRGLRAIAQPAGDIGQNPWQSPLVRIASERCMGVTVGTQINLHAAAVGRGSPAVLAEFRAVAERVGQLVDCHVDFAEAAN
jgi:hypothetical protein